MDFQRPSWITDSPSYSSKAAVPAAWPILNEKDSISMLPFSQHCSFCYFIKFKTQWYTPVSMYKKDYLDLSISHNCKLSLITFKEHEFRPFPAYCGTGRSPILISFGSWYKTLHALLMVNLSSLHCNPTPLICSHCKCLSSNKTTWYLPLHTLSKPQPTFTNLLKSISSPMSSNLPWAWTTLLSLYLLQML